jgi:hypothetical protein
MTDAGRFEEVRCPRCGCLLLKCPRCASLSSVTVRPARPETEPEIRSEVC